MEVYISFGPENFGGVYYFRILRPWKCILFSELNTLEVYTICGSENRGSVYTIFGLKTLEVYTIVGSENVGSVYYVRT